MINPLLTLNYLHLPLTNILCLGNWVRSYEPDPSNDANVSNDSHAIQYSPGALIRSKLRLMAPFS